MLTILTKKALIFLGVLRISNLLLCQPFLLSIDMSFSILFLFCFWCCLWAWFAAVCLCAAVYF